MLLAQSRHRNQVGRRAAVDHDGVLAAEPRGELALEGRDLVALGEARNMLAREEFHQRELVGVRDIVFHQGPVHFSSSNGTSVHSVAVFSSSTLRNCKI